MEQREKEDAKLEIKRKDLKTTMSTLETSEEVQKRHIEEVKRELEKQQTKIRDQLRKELNAVKNLENRKAELVRRRTENVQKANMAEEVSSMAMIKAKLLNSKVLDSDSKISPALRKLKERLNKKAGRNKIATLYLSMQKKLQQEEQRISKLEDELNNKIQAEKDSFDEEKQIDIQSLKEATKIQISLAEKKLKHLLDSLEAVESKINTLNESGESTENGAIDDLITEKHSLEPKIKNAQYELEVLQEEHITKMKDHITKFKTMKDKMEKKHEVMRSQLRDQGEIVRMKSSQGEDLSAHIENMSKEQLLDLAEVQNEKKKKYETFKMEMVRETSLIEEKKRDIEAKIQNLESMVIKNQKTIESNKRKQRVWAKRKKKKNERALMKERFDKESNTSSNRSEISKLKKEYVSTIAQCEAKFDQILVENMDKITEEKNEAISQLKESGKDVDIDHEIENLEMKSKTQQSLAKDKNREELDIEKQKITRLLQINTERTLENTKLVCDSSGTHILVHLEQAIPRDDLGDLVKVRAEIYVGDKKSGSIWLMSHTILKRKAKVIEEKTRRREKDKKIAEKQKDTSKGTSNEAEDNATNSDEKPDETNDSINSEHDKLNEAQKETKNTEKKLNETEDNANNADEKSDKTKDSDNRDHDKSSEIQKEGNNRENKSDEKEDNANNLEGKSNTTEDNANDSDDDNKHTENNGEKTKSDVDNSDDKSSGTQKKTNTGKNKINEAGEKTTTKSINITAQENNECTSNTKIVIEMKIDNISESRSAEMHQTCIINISSRKTFDWHEKILLPVVDGYHENLSLYCKVFDLTTPTKDNSPKLIGRFCTPLEGVKSDGIFLAPVIQDDASSNIIRSLSLGWLRVKEDNSKVIITEAITDYSAESFTFQDLQDKVKHCKGIVVSIKEGSNLMTKHIKNNIIAKRKINSGAISEKSNDEIHGAFFVECRLGKLGSQWSEKEALGWGMDKTHTVYHNHPRYNCLLWLPIGINTDNNEQLNSEKKFRDMMEQFDTENDESGDYDKAALHVRVWNNPSHRASKGTIHINDPNSSLLFVGEFELVLNPMDTCLPGSKLLHLPLGAELNSIVDDSACVSLSWWLAESPDQLPPAEISMVSSNMHAPNEDQDNSSDEEIEDRLVYYRGKKIPLIAAGEGGILPPDSSQDVAGGVSVGDWMCLTVHGCAGLPENNFRGNNGVFVKLVIASKRSDGMLGFEEKFQNALHGRCYKTSISENLFNPQFMEKFYFRDIFNENKSKSMDSGNDTILQLHIAVYDDEPGEPELVGESTMDIVSKRSLADEPFRMKLLNSGRLQNDLGDLFISWKSFPVTEMPWAKVFLSSITNNIPLESDESLLLKMVVEERGSLQNPPSLKPVRRFYRKWDMVRPDRRHLWHIDIPDTERNNSNTNLIIERSFWFRVNSPVSRFHFDTLLKPELHVAYFKRKNDDKGFEQLLSEVLIPLNAKKSIKPKPFEMVSKNLSFEGGPMSIDLSFECRQHPYTGVKRWKNDNKEIYDRLDNLQNLMSELEGSNDVDDAGNSESDDELSENEYILKRERRLKERKMHLFRHRISQFPEPKYSANDIFPAGYRRSLSFENANACEKFHRRWLKLTINRATGLPEGNWRGRSQTFVELVIVTSDCSKSVDGISWKEKHSICSETPTHHYRTKMVNDQFNPIFQQNFFSRNVFLNTSDTKWTPPQLHIAVFDEEPGGDELVGEAQCSLTSARSDGDKTIPILCKDNTNNSNIIISWEDIDPTPIQWLKVEIANVTKLTHKDYILPKGSQVYIAMIISERGSEQNPPSLEPVRRFHQKWKVSPSYRKHQWVASNNTTNLTCGKTFWFRVNDPYNDELFNTILEPELHISFFAFNSTAGGNASSASKQLQGGSNPYSKMLGEVVISPEELLGNRSSNGFESYPLSVTGSVQLQWLHSENPETTKRKWNKRREIIKLDVDLLAEANEHKKRQRRHSRLAQAMAKREATENRLLAAFEIASAEEQRLKTILESLKTSVESSERAANQAYHLAEEANGIVSDARSHLLQEDHESKVEVAEEQKQKLIFAQQKYDDMKERLQLASHEYNAYNQAEMERIKRALEAKVKRRESNAKRDTQTSENNDNDKENSTDSDEDDSDTSDDDETRQCKRLRRSQRSELKKQGHHKPSTHTLNKHNTRALAMEKFGHMFDISSRRKEMLKKYTQGGHRCLSLEDFEIVYNHQKKWERKTIKRHHRNNNAATEIQSIFRGYKSREMREAYLKQIAEKEVAKAAEAEKRQIRRRHRHKLKVAMISKTMSGNVKKKKRRRRRKTHVAKLRNSVKLTRIVQKGNNSMEVEKEAINLDDMSRKGAAATKIQSKQRQRAAYAKYKQRNLDSTTSYVVDSESGSDSDLQNRYAAIRIQSFERGRHEQNRYSNKRRSAVKIQSYQRGRSVRSRMSTIDASDSDSDLKYSAATRIQSYERGRHEQNRYSNKRRSAVKIQSYQRGRDVRSRMNTIDLSDSDSDLDLKNYAATRIQSVERGRREKYRYNNKRSSQERDKNVKPQTTNILEQPESRNMVASFAEKYPQVLQDEYSEYYDYSDDY